MDEQDRPEAGNEDHHGLMYQNFLLKKRNHELEMRLLRLAGQDDDLLASGEDQIPALGFPHATPALKTEDSPINLEADQDIVMETSGFPRSFSIPARILSPAPARRVIKSKEDLSQAERKHAVFDMLKSRRRCCEVENGLSVEVTIEDCDDAIDRALQGWHTGLPPRRMKTLPKTVPDSHRTSRVIYATFADTDDAHLLPTDCRKEGADIYLYFSPFNIGGDAKRFSFRDAKGNPVKEHLVRPHSGVDLDNMKEALMHQYDREERLIVKRINDQLMIAKTQRRLEQFADRGEGNRTQPFFDARLERKHLDFVVAGIYAI